MTEVKTHQHTYASLMYAVTELTHKHGMYETIQIVRKDGAWEARLYYATETKH